MKNDSQIIENSQSKPLTDVFWRKIKEEMQIDILLETKPKKQLKLYPIEEEDMHINLDQVCEWSENNQTLYEQIAENGFADFICNKEHIRENYKELLFDDQNINALDSDLNNFKNLQFLRVNINIIEKIENIPNSLVELHLFQNQISRISNKIRSENLLFLGLGHNKLQDFAINSLSNNFPNLLSLDICYNDLSQIDVTLQNIKPFKQLKMLSLYGNPLSLVKNYKNAVLFEIRNLHYFDEIKIFKEEFGLNKAKEEQINVNELEQYSPLRIKRSNTQNQQQNEEDQNNDTDGQQFIKEFQQFQFRVQIPTLENPDGVLLDKSVYEKFDQHPKLFQTCYWIEFEVQGQKISTKEKPLLFENIFKDNDEKTRFGVEFDHTFNFEINESNRNFIREGFTIQIYRSDPILNKVADSDELKPELNEQGLPKITEKLFGVVLIDTQNWLKDTQNPRQIQYKYPLFEQNILKVPDFFYPLKNESELLSKNAELVQNLIKQRDQLLIPVEADVNKKDAKKGKDNKKKDDKKGKTGKKGKEEQIEEKIVELIDWPVYPRDKVFSQPQQVLLSIKDVLITVKVSLQ